MVADCPFSHLTEHGAVVVYDNSSSASPNPMASRLTTIVETGLQLDIKGDALVFYTSPGSSFGVSQWEELDNVIYDELLEYFGQGLRPQPADVARLVADFKAGRFRYAADAGGNGDDANKDDGSLPGWG